MLQVIEFGSRFTDCQICVAFLCINSIGQSLKLRHAGLSRNILRMNACNSVNNDTFTFCTFTRFLDGSAEHRKPWPFTYSWRRRAVYIWLECQLRITYEKWNAQLYMKSKQLNELTFSFQSTRKRENKSIECTKSICILHSVYVFLQPCQTIHS